MCGPVEVWCLLLHFHMMSKLFFNNNFMQFPMCEIHGLFVASCCKNIVPHRLNQFGDQINIFLLKSRASGWVPGAICRSGCRTCFSQNPNLCKAATEQRDGRLHQPGVRKFQYSDSLSTGGGTKPLCCCCHTSTSICSSSV
jgi:hypothetical protein